MADSNVEEIVPENLNSVDVGVPGNAGLFDDFNLWKTK